MTTGVTCTVLVDGVRAADGSPGDDLAGPVILDDLSVTWGRSDTMSQPEADSCSFEVMDQLGGESFMARFRTGARVDVVARGLTYPDPTVETFANPGFELSTPVTWSASGGTATRTSSRFRSGAYSLAVKPATAGVRASVLLAPGELQAPGTNPAAWDEIPTTSPGQTWSIAVSVLLPTGASSTVRAALFSGPYATAASPAGPTRTIVGDDTWQTVSVTLPVQLDAAWVGLQLVLDPTGPSWDELPPALTWDAVTAARTWDELGTLYVDDVSVRAPSAGSGRSVLVFSGRVTDLEAAWDDSTSSPVAKVTAVGFTADLQNRIVGDEPWPVEDVELRAHRILDLAGLPISVDIDSSIDSTLLSYRDVDAQGATGLLTEIATSVDGVLWSAVHQTIGAYLRLEDPALRASLLQLALVGGVIVVVQGDPDIGFDLSACMILRDPVKWVQDVSDVVTRVSVSWQVQELDDDGLPTTSEATELVVDPALEAAYGTRGASISTQLQAAVDAQDVAQRVLTRSTPSGWRADGLTIDDDDVDGTVEGIALVLDLLDGTSRIGAPIVLGELPQWTPAGTDVGVYLEGGTYRYVGGRWVLDLLVSSAGGLGASAAWDELDPAWTWNQWDPRLSWNDLRGVAA
jgi:hypothetical protein